MFRNYLIVAFRNLVRNPVQSAINVIGLSVGIACCLLMLLFVQDELSYDRYHENGERFYRVLRTTEGNEGASAFEWSTSGALGPALKANIPEVEEFARVYTQWGEINTGDDRFSRLYCVADLWFWACSRCPLLPEMSEGRRKHRVPFF